MSIDNDRLYRVDRQRPAVRGGARGLTRHPPRRGSNTRLGQRAGQYPQDPARLGGGIVVSFNILVRRITQQYSSIRRINELAIERSSLLGTAWSRYFAVDNLDDAARVRRSPRVPTVDVYYKKDRAIGWVEDWPKDEIHEQLSRLPYICSDRFDFRHRRT